MKKEIIYKEVLAMLNDGAAYKDVTLNEVAARCGMGKSTLYDYFNGKDEMIYNSFLYYVNRMINFFSGGFRVTTFEASLRNYLKSLFVCMSANYWMVLPWTFNSYTQYFNETDADTLHKLLDKSQNLMIELLTTICDVGLEEDMVAEFDEYRVRFVFFGIVGELSCAINDGIDIAEEEGKMFLDDLILTVQDQLA